MECLQLMKLDDGKVELGYKVEWETTWKEGDYGSINILLNISSTVLSMKILLDIS